MLPTNLWIVPSCNENIAGSGEIGRVEAFCEPAVDRREQVVGLSAFALLLPQTGEARGGTQFQRLTSLVAGRIQRTGKCGFGFRCRRQTSS